MKILFSSLFLLLIVANSQAQTKKATPTTHTTTHTQKSNSGLTFNVNFSLEQTLVYYLKSKEVKTLKPTIVEKIINVAATGTSEAVNKAEKKCVEFVAKEEFIREEKVKDPENDKKELVYKIFARYSMKQISGVEPAK